MKITSSAHFVPLAAILISISLQGCVSKKKYESLQAAQRRSSMALREAKKENSQLKQDLKTSTNKSRSLDTQLGQLKKEYSRLKNSMSRNNAKKDTEISQLTERLQGLSSDKNALKDSLEAAIGRFKKREKSLQLKEDSLSGQILMVRQLDAALNTYNTELTRLYNSVSNGLKDHEDEGLLVLRDENSVKVTIPQGLLETKAGKLTGRSLVMANQLSKTLSEHTNSEVIMLSSSDNKEALGLIKESLVDKGSLLKKAILIGESESGTTLELKPNDEAIWRAIEQ